MEGKGKGMKTPLVVSWKEARAITLSLPDTDLRGAVETIDAATAGEARFGCDACFLLSVVNAVGCETIAIEAPREPGRRIRITAVEDPGFVAIVMPMWLSQTVEEYGEAAKSILR
jgi:hypothetical protein